MITLSIMASCIACCGGVQQVSKLTCTIFSSPEPKAHR